MTDDVVGWGPRSTARRGGGKKTFAMPLPFRWCSCHSSDRTGMGSGPVRRVALPGARYGADQGQPSRSGVRVDDRMVISGVWPALAGMGFDGVHRFSWVRQAWADHRPGKG